MATIKGPGNTNTEKDIWPWDKLMRQYRAMTAGQDECRTLSCETQLSRAQQASKQFPTGSKYEGTWDVFGKNGEGTYTFPNGVIYIGEFEDGLFHGQGELKYPGGAALTGTWKRGHLTEKTLYFDDGLEYNEENWLYCKMPDRRYALEYKEGLQPGGQSYRTAEQPTQDVPNGYYDTADGFFEPESLIVYKADNINEIIRSAGPEEAKWILDNCRTSPEDAIGPRPDLYEEWSKAETDPLPPPPPAAAARFTRRETAFSNDPDWDDDDVFFGNLRKSSAGHFTNRHASTGRYSAHHASSTGSKGRVSTRQSISAVKISTHRFKWQV